MADGPLGNGKLAVDLMISKIDDVHDAVIIIGGKVDKLSGRMSTTEGKIRCEEHAEELRDLRAGIANADTIGKVAVAKIGAMAAIIAAVIAAMHDPIQKAISTIGGQ